MIDRSNQYDGYTEEDNNAKSQRNFFVRTYNNFKDTYDKLSKDYQAQIKHFHIIEHNQDDLKGRHSHIVIVTMQPTSVSAVHKWFKDLTDDSGIYGNTFVEIPHSMDSAYQYLVHANNPEKERYDVVQIRHFGNSGPCINAIKKVPGFDPVIQAYEDYKRGVSSDVLVQKYGRDYLYHITQFERAISVCIRDENQSLEVDNMRKQLHIIQCNFEDFLRTFWLYLPTDEPFYFPTKVLLDLVSKLQFISLNFDSEELDSFDFESIKKQLKEFI